VATVPVPSLSTVVAQIGSLFERAYSAEARKPSLEEIDDVLARAIRCARMLEDERCEIEAKVRELVAPGGDPQSLFELRSLGARHAKADRNSRWLRALAAELQEYRTALPVAVD
jgi:Arc/MetJ family transcription regulator